MSGSERVLTGSDLKTAVVKTNLDDSIVNVLGGYYLGVPVIDETGLSGRYYFILSWSDQLQVRTDSGAPPPPPPTLDVRRRESPPVWNPATVGSPSATESSAWIPAVRPKKEDE